MLLQRILESTGEIEVVGTARSGVEAFEMIPRLDPAVVCTDLHMPDMNGLELTRRIVAEYPRPVLVVSASTHPDDVHNVFEVLEAGAVDVMPKPMAATEAGYEAIARELISKIKILAGVFVFRKWKHHEEKPARRTAAPRTPGVTPRIIVVGASTGGPQALLEIFSALPETFGIPIVCVQHINRDFLPGFIDWLQSQCRLKLRVAQPGMKPEPGYVYFPRGGAHLEFDPHGRFIETRTAVVDGHCPSVTVAMISASRHFGSGVLGILLTGMGRDGADGMRAVVEAGGMTIAQTEQSSIVFGMPKQAIDIGAAQWVLSPEEIAGKLLQLKHER
jgi:two-component system chemotaxis response regulator CheB